MIISIASRLRNENNEWAVEYGGKLVAYNGYNCVAPRFGIANYSRLLNSNRNTVNYSRVYGI